MALRSPWVSETPQAHGILWPQSTMNTGDAQGRGGNEIRPGQSYIASASKPLLSPNSPNSLSLCWTLKKDTADKGAHRATVSVSGEHSLGGCQLQAPARPWHRPRDGWPALIL